MEVDDGVLDNDWDRFWRTREERARALFAAPYDAVRLPVVSRFYLKNKCSAGVKCKFIHQYIEDKLPLCEYIEGGCPDGVGHCIFRHHYVGRETRKRPRFDPARVAFPTADDATGDAGRNSQP